jgi:hypothetical protein
VIAPIAWALYTGLAWIIPSAACDADAGRAPWHAASAVALALVLTGLAGGALRLAHLRRKRSWSAIVAGPHGFITVLGTLVAALLAAGIVIAWSYGFALGPCS